MSAGEVRALVWGVRASFLEYVRGADGTVTAVAPATATRDGQFRFPFDHAEGAELHFRGEVSLWAHEGALAVRFLEPMLVRGADGGPDALTTDLWEAGEHKGRRVIAVVRPDGSAQLAAAGRVAFNFIYPEGSALAPVRLERA